jgi:genome maintenance exonuclease 1
MIFTHRKIDLGYGDLQAQTSKSGRTYETPTGKAYPSITTVLSILSEDSIRAWRKRVGEEEANKISHRASTRGTKVHAIVEDYLNNESIDNYLPDVRASLANLQPILDARIGEIYGIEVPLYSDYLGVAGRCDCVAMFDGVPSILDFKTSRKKKKREWIHNYFAQGAAYAIMFEERTGMPIPNVVIVMDVDNDDPIVFKEHRDEWTGLLTDTIQKYKMRQK